MSRPDKKLYKSTFNTIYSYHENETSDEIKTCIEAHQNVLKKKKFTKVGERRKEITFEKRLVKQKNVPVS